MTPDDFTVFETLRRHNVPFVIVGGHAVNHYGYARATEDCDAVWLRTRESEQALTAALDELGAQYIGKEIDPATRIEKTYPVTLAHVRSHHLMMLVVKTGFLDLFDYIPGHPAEDVEQLFQSSVEFQDFRVASLEWLRRMKIAAGRSKDLTDLENLPDPKKDP